MDVHPVSPDVLPDRLADWLVDRTARAGWTHPVRVAVDGAPPGRPDRLADSLATALRVRGRPVRRVGARWFWRPASLRLERGRHDPLARYQDWLDTSALRREVLDRLGPGGDRRFLPTLRDPDTDRATRAGYQSAAPDTVLLVDGALLLGAGLPFDLTVHIRLSAGALRRRTPAADTWMLPAFDRYEAQVSPAGHADALVLADDPAHPAVRFASPSAGGN